MGLIVPISELEAIKQKIQKAGTNESRLFSTVQEEAKKHKAAYKQSLVMRRK